MGIIGININNILFWLIKYLQKYELKLLSFIYI